MEANLKLILVCTVILVAIMIKTVGFIMTGTILYYTFWFGLVVAIIKILLSAVKQTVPRKR